MKKKSGSEIHEESQETNKLAEQELQRILIEHWWVFESLWLLGDGKGGYVINEIKKSVEGES